MWRTEDGSRIVGGKEEDGTDFHLCRSYGYYTNEVTLPGQIISGDCIVVNGLEFGTFDENYHILVLENEEL